LILEKKDTEREGFAVLHGKWDDKTIVGINAKSSHHVDMTWQMRNPKWSIGYFAYPNLALKNKIPDSKFYIYEEIFHSKSVPAADVSFQTSGHLEQSVTKSEYIKKIIAIKELLAAGEIYQLNYAIRFRKKFKGSPYALFLKLTDINPVDFSAYLNCGDFQIISSSPERLFKVQNGKIITQPIKGTAPKYETRNTKPETRKLQFEFRTSSLEFLSPKEIKDKNLLKLLQSEKERAELDMITDLERNDVGKICEYGTLKLARERAVLEMKNIWHTYSEVHGKLRSDVGFDEIIKAMFPGGSITGCPKKRAMEYIELLEGIPRNIFTGSIGYISNCGPALRALTSPSGVDQPFGRGFIYDKNNIIPREAGPRRSLAHAKLAHNCKMDFNIAIRTALVQNGYIEYWAGGGIVADSDPENEYKECLLKAERFLSII
jgi:anthranilate/para-aminobenzoate synthase component I